VSTGINLGDPYKSNRSRWVSRILLIAGVVLAVVAGVATYTYAVTPRTTGPSEVATVDVLVAARDLAARSALGPGDVKVVKLPPDLVPTGALRDTGAAVGMITTVPLAANEPVLPAKIAAPGSEGHIAVFPPGTTAANSAARFRAMSINIPDANAAGGAIQAGDHIDIMYTLSTTVVDPSRKDFVGRVVIEDIPVLAKTNTVYTLRVDVSTAERIAALAAGGGAINLLLRAPSDTRPSGSAGSSFTREAQSILRP
jgi:Flp pilus assembly protein CpaB